MDESNRKLLLEDDNRFHEISREIAERVIEKVSVNPLHNMFERSLQIQQSDRKASDASTKYESAERLWSMFISSLSYHLHGVSALSFSLEGMTENFLTAMVELEGFPAFNSLDEIVKAVGYILYFTFIHRTAKYLLKAETVRIIILLV